MSIPKVIHYCWFGGNPKPSIIQNCIDSWKKYCFDYDIIEWNEDNFNVNEIPYTRDAYAAAKYAFVSDYARLKIVFDNGGIYLDTDVLLHNTLDNLLKYDCWLASDDVRYINTGMGFGAIKGNKVIGALANAYRYRVFPAGINTYLDTEVLEKTILWEKSDVTQVDDSICIIGMRNYSAYAKHLLTYSWADDDFRKKREEAILQNKPLTKKELRKWKLKCWARSPEKIAYFDRKRGTRIEHLYTFFAYDFLDYGPMYYVKRCVQRLKRCRNA